MQVDLDLDAALGVVEELLLGPSSILVQLRARQGLNHAQYDALIRAIEVLIELHGGRDSVPKRLALAFVDISNYFYYTEDYYPQDVLDELEDAGQKLTQLASQLFS